jgi:hypothetical protein
MSTEGHFRVERSPVLELVAYLTDAWLWMDSAGDCLDAMRAGAVKP